jgi:hypothetical protein
MPKKPHFFWCALAVFALSLCAWLIWRPGISIEPETCDKIKPGMTMKEVETILGGTPGFYGISGVQSVAPARKEGWRWVSRRWEIVVMLDENKRVKTANCYRVTPLD